MENANEPATGVEERQGVGDAWRGRLRFVGVVAAAMQCSAVRGVTMSCTKEVAHLVTLKTRKRRTQRKTETPSGGMTFVLVSTSSIMLLMTTKQSNRLNSDTK